MEDPGKASALVQQYIHAATAQCQSSEKLRIMVRNWVFD
jgi:hypothetical protein